MHRKNIRDIIFNIDEAYRNKLYFLSERLLKDIVDKELQYYKLYLLYAYLTQLENDEEKLKISIHYSSKTIEYNKHYLLAYCYRYKASKRLLEICKDNKLKKQLEKLISNDINYLKNSSNNFIIKKHIKNFIKNPLSYYDRNKLILKTSSQIKKYMKYFNREKSKYDYIDIMENYNFLIKNNDNDYEAYNLRGFLKYNLKIYDEALEDFNKSINLNSRLAENYYNRAKLYYALKHYEEALKDFRKAQKIFVRNNIDSPLDIIKCDHYIAWCNYSLMRDEKIFLDIEVDEDINDFSEGYYNSAKLKFNKKNYAEALKIFSKVDKNNKNYAKTKYYKNVCKHKINNNININLIVNTLRLSDIYKYENDFHVTENLCNEALEYIEYLKEKNDFWYLYLKGIALYELYDISFLNYKLKEEALYYLNKAKENIEKENKYYKRIEEIITDITEYGI
ncbi:tetratricopeptide repeat protein [Brachyspira hyodysenteriae]|uniref:tetratricopeptide repeat protein n=1 Tax=Brachyspira hyodysenteriae TaxID=159 RepID=UPI0011842E0C|nr:tetratricopeptide repeat protein [Brachyspira hyodysenteriae]MCZ9850895.1 tetratricopeptide repeat protein [Brachyspira hyodysenteriae]MCZ9860352.1 tetratricopeptide repeat protein [Brachyspira hyodysenteriae]MCZ9869367.1 tetratricopeptide repeat protein [Brachyspira hyodysenteriae]MCZ9874725.1 tetratricopeptide repeat protein [Brachyspira hyodysenteriae]MCZ9879845.1 tetratricopeptide repeat protein [Brachyspira hyodysenteriae]